MTTIGYAREDGLGIITMDDGKANGQGPTFVRALGAALDAAERDAVGAVVIVGRPGVFCGGLHIKELPTLSPAELGEFGAHYCEMFARVYLFPRPVVCVATGHAIAGGAVLLLCGDARVGVRGAFRIGLNEVPIGVAFPPSIAAICTQRLPNQLHTEALLVGKIYDPESALRAGFVDELADGEAAALARGRELAAQMARLPQGAFAMTKEVVRGQVRSLLAAQDVGVFAGRVAAGASFMPRS